MYLTYKALLTKGKPKRLIIAGLIGSEQGLAYLQKNLPDASIYVADIDAELDINSYIVPGLGDAGDLAYGEKL
jgi:uracil phosphoribosyltransferase